ncbi:MAG: acetolactate synthase large subunit [Rubrivivax sp.]
MLTPTKPAANGLAQNGAESLVTTLADSGVGLCFANPGTSEMHFVAALDRIDGVRCVLALFEGVATGAADGYWRMTGNPAATLLHLGPGLGNGWANLHNARKARSGLINIVGDHATDHIGYESPLKSDLPGVARSISHWTRHAQRAADVGADGAAAVVAARDGAVGRIATLMLPADTAWGPGGQAQRASAPAAAPPAPDAAVEAAARTLQSLGDKALLLLGAAGVRDERAQHLAAAIGAKTGCRVMAEFYNPRMPGGRGRPAIPRLPYAVDAAAARLAGTQAVVLAGSVDPIAFFAYPNKPSRLLPPGAALLTLAEPRQDVPAALQALADALGAKPVSTSSSVRSPVPASRSASAAAASSAPALPTGGALTPDSIAAAIAATLPENAIVVDEAVTTGRGFGPAMAAAAPHDWLQGMGGAIGYGLPCAVGAAIGAPGRPVLALEGDGSAMYTLQALWTMARESLPVVVVIFANRAYRILQGELQGVGATVSGQKATDMLSLERPSLDWVALARGHGMLGERVEDAGALALALQRGFASGAPCLIEASF